MPAELSDIESKSFRQTDFKAGPSHGGAPLAAQGRSAGPILAEQLEQIKRALVLVQAGVEQVEQMLGQVRAAATRWPSAETVSRAEFEHQAARIVELENALRRGGTPGALMQPEHAAVTRTPFSPSRPANSFAQAPAPFLPPAPVPAEANDPRLDQGQFRDCWHRLTTALTGQPETSERDRIIADTDQTGASSQARREALARAALRRIDPQPLTPGVIDALRAFLKEFLGSAADLVLPRSGDRFEHRLHEDIAPPPTGIGRTLSEVVFPGAYSGDRVLLRAAVRTA